MDCFGWLVEQKMGRKVRKRKLLPYFCDKDRFLFVELLETMTARSTGLMVRFDFVMKMERVAFCLYFFHNNSFLLRTPNTYIEFIQNEKLRDVK